MPPSGMQNYGPHFEGANHEDMQMGFQYSMCTGRKRALLVRRITFPFLNFRRPFGLWYR
jgi:hypothetical protein